jgi:hypothetical protein
MHSSRARRRSPGKAGATTRAKARPLVDPPRIHTGVAFLTLLAFACLFLALQIPVARDQSATWDEPGHITAGYAILAAGDYRVDIEHPPILRIWMALPLMFKQGVQPDLPVIDPARPETIAFTGPFEAGHTFLYKRNDADGILFAARAMVMSVGLLLGVLVYWWVTEAKGQRAATVALALLLFEPNLAAHAGLATTDFGVTTFSFGAVFFLWRANRSWTWVNITAATAFFVLAVFTKFSALILLPILPALLLIASPSPRSSKLRQVAILTGALVLAGWCVAWLVYGLHYEPSRVAGSRIALHAVPAIAQTVPGWTALVSFGDRLHLLPNALGQGFLHAQSLAVSRPAFFAGEYSTQGWWYYFPAAILLKTPIVILLLFGIGVFVAFRRQPSSFGVFLLIPTATFLAFAMTSNLNIGLRHVLPIYPFMVVLATMGVESVVSNMKRRDIGTVALVGLAALEFGVVYPHNLAYFNVLAGGPSNGFRYLADSNVDWGQDLERLKSWMNDRHVNHINLAYFGVAEPAYYGIDRTDLWGTTIPGVAPSAMGPPRLPGYVAISVTLLDGVPFGERGRDFYAPLREREPAAKIGGSIRVYWVDAPWWRR